MRFRMFDLTEGATIHIDLAAVVYVERTSKKDNVVELGFSASTCACVRLDHAEFDAQFAQLIDEWKRARVRFGRLDIDAR